MPLQDTSHPEEKEAQQTKEFERVGSRPKVPTLSSTSKTKDLSHVPCKFFKVGGCTAGSSCPFSHHVVEPGGQKETCAWFVKGTCKFGHKCALAHILPGQSMAMDRKNKKAAQLAATLSAAERGDKLERGVKDGRGGRNQRRDDLSAASSGNRNNSLLGTGATAPTRILGTKQSTPSVRPPMMKATLSPSVPAPPLASFGVFDDLEESVSQLPTAPAQIKPGSLDGRTSTPTNIIPLATGITAEQSEMKNTTITSPHPTYVPLLATSPCSKRNFGPVGSPPPRNTLSPSQMNANGVLGTSPRHINEFSGSPRSTVSPFSAPGTQTTFFPKCSHAAASGMASSLNALSLVGYGGWGGIQGSKPRVTEESVVNEGDLEDFLPSSLTDLLTPEERTRRMSRSNSGQPAPVVGTDSVTIREVDLEFSGNAGMGSAALGHRHSRSVPAPSFLGDARSIWANNSTSPASPPPNPSPFATVLEPPKNHGAGEELGLSMSMGSAGSGMMSLSPSNASAAFLPGLHSHYLNAKAKQTQQSQQLGLGLSGFGRSNLRNTSAPLYNGTSNNVASLSKTSIGSTSLHSLSSSNTNSPHVPHSFRGTPSPLELAEQRQQQNLLAHITRPIFPQVSSTSSLRGANKNTDVLDDLQSGTHLTSPSMRALRSHTPGQSLPQGLAAGYSRIHALPPPPVWGSPASGGPSIPIPSGIAGDSDSGDGSGKTASTNPTCMSPGLVGGGLPYGGWKGVPSSPAGNTVAGIDSVFSRLSYSASAFRSGPTGNVTGAATTGNGGGAPTGTAAGNGNGSDSPPGLARNVNGGRYSQPLSPLSGPVVTSNDDDDLFSMDG